MQQLKEWGRGRSYPSVMHSLDVLNKCHLAVKSNSDTGINARGAILTELISYQQTGLAVETAMGSGRHVSIRS